MIRAQHHDVGGATVFAEVAGEGVPLLCIHSAGQSGVQWRDVLRELPASGFQVIVPDLPGHGRSDPSPAGPVADLAEYAVALRELLEQLGAAAPYVVGCSIGGKISLELALDPAVAVRGVVAMAADAHNGRLSLRALERSLEDAASPSRSDRTYFGTLACIGRTVPAARAERIAAMHRREDPLVTTGDLMGWTTHDLRDRLPDIRCPVRLVAGEDDFWLDLEDARWTAEQIPRCTYDQLSGIGHYPMEEIPAFPQLLAEWLGELAAAQESEERWTTSRQSSS